MSKYDFELSFDPPNSLSVILDMIKPNSKVLEFGPAHGRMTKYLKEQLGCSVDIVEIDAEAGMEASKYANVSLLGKNDGNIENYIWLETLNLEDYDYVIFADVLEHLIKPQDVIEKCKGVLKHNGSILISLPNIAHNSILINLYFNKFKYTDVGLLDNTHIKFFALDELEAIYKSAGLVLAEFHTIEALSELTEQASFFDANYKKVEKLFDGRELAEVYQFVLRLQKSEYAEGISIDVNNFNKKYTEIPVTIYFNSGDGYNQLEKETRVINVINHIQERFEIHKGVKSLRFDPTEDYPCNVKILHIETDAEIENIQPINSSGNYTEDKNFDEFLNLDPMYEITGDFNNATYIEIEAEIKLINVLKFYDRAGTVNEKAICDVKTSNKELKLVKEQLRVNKEQLEQAESQLQLKQSQLQLTEGELQYTQSELHQTQNELHQTQNELHQTQNELHQTQNELHQTQNELHQTQKVLHQTQDQLTQIMESTCWKITKPVRIVLDRIKQAFKLNKYTHLCCKGIKSLKQNGIKVTWIKAKNKVQKHRNSYKSLNEGYFVAEREKIAQKNTKFDKDIKFSILTPLYNTPEKFLRQMIESVLDQTYNNWELCLADGSDVKHSEVGLICQEYVKKDKRIQYKKLTENIGISGNTNQCIDMSTGDYIALLDHDDLLHSSALYEVMRVICENGAEFIYTDENTFSESPLDAYCPHFKPNYSPDTLRSYNYICHLSVFSKKLLERVGYFRNEFDGSQDYDVILRLTESTKSITHIPKILYYWRAHQNSVALDVAAKPYVIEAAKKALTEHLQRMGLDGEVTDSAIVTTYKINYKIEGYPLVSIIIPNKDHVEDLKKCINSIYENSTYQNYEILIIENNSVERDIFNYYKTLENYDKIKVIEWIGEFNYSAINNFGVENSNGEYILFLNNDTEVITHNWIEEMLMFAQRKDVGAVGTKLLYPDDTIQHAGVILGVGGVGGHSHKYFKRCDTGYMSRLTIAQNVSACTAACLMMPRNVFDEIDGFDESFRVAFNDVDLCMRIRKLDYLIIFTPYAELYHYESKTRGYEDTNEKQMRFQNEVLSFQHRWKNELQEGDPYYNMNLTLEREDFGIADK